jgi:outer membrane protein assembly factor BamB
MDVKILKIGVVIGVSLLFFSSAMVIPIGLTEKNTIIRSDVLINDFNSKKDANSNNVFKTILSDKMAVSNPTSILDGPMDSPWPMYCYDVRHTGRSPYSTFNNDEKWKVETWGPIRGGPAIAEDGTIYAGAYSLFAIYPNGTLKWSYHTDGWIDGCCPAIDENGTIYVGTWNNIFYAIYPNGTLKWKYNVRDWIASSPAIGNDGSIYFGSEDDYIYALFPNGTLKWKYLTSVAVYSSPAIGDDGTVYCGSHDGNLYALYPNNGTLKWAFHTGGWVRTSPCIADDGTIYCVSLDNYLYAIYPNGTMRWRTYMGEAGTSPTIGQDGTIYAGYTKLHAINPTDGSLKWIFDPGPGRNLQGATPCNSIDGTIYFGTSDAGEIIAVNPDGTEKWREYIGGDVESPPTIGEDGTVYIGDGRENGYLHAFGQLNPNAPSAPEINGPASGKAGTEYEYTFKSISPLGRNVYYYIDWGDNTINDWFGPYDSGETVTVSHTWSSRGTYMISARAKDTDNLWGPWGTLFVTMPLDLQISQSSGQQINQYSSNQLLLKMLQKLLLNIR